MPDKLTNNLLDQLPPLHLPEPVSFWPPAIGWWLSMVVVLALLLLTLRYFIKRKRKNQLRNAALRELDVLWQSYQEENSAEKYLVAVNRLLKQFAMQQYPNKNLHVLSGAEWLNGLNELSPQSGFNSDTASILLSIYAKHADHIDKDVRALYPLLVQWLKGLRIAS